MLAAVLSAGTRGAVAFNDESPHRRCSAGWPPRKSSRSGALTATPASCSPPTSPCRVMPATAGQPGRAFVALRLTDVDLVVQGTDSSAFSTRVDLAALDAFIPRYLFLTLVFLLGGRCRVCPGDAAAAHDRRADRPARRTSARSSASSATTSAPQGVERRGRHADRRLQRHARRRSRTAIGNCAAHQEQLEEQVTARTAELRQVNADLMEAKNRAEDANSRQERVPGQHEPRDPHADERHHRHDRADARHRARPPSSASTSTMVKIVGRRAAGDHQRHPRFLEDRGAQARARVDPILACATLIGETVRAAGAARPREGARAHLRHLAATSRRRSSATRCGCARCSSTWSATRSSSPSDGHVAGGDRRRSRRSRDDGRRCTFQVIDTGIGIPADKQDADLRAVQPGGRLDDAPLRRHRSRPDHLVAAGDDDGRADLGREHARAGQHVPLHGAARRRRGGRSRDAEPPTCRPAACWSSTTTRSTGACFEKTLRRWRMKLTLVDDGPAALDALAAAARARRAVHAGAARRPHAGHGRLRGRRADRSAARSRPARSS